MLNTEVQMHSTHYLTCRKLSALVQLLLIVFQAKLICFQMLQVNTYVTMIFYCMAVKLDLSQ